SSGTWRPTGTWWVLSSRRRRAGVGAVALAATVLMTSGGCAVEQSPDPQEESVERVLADGHVEIDLNDPPSRADLAVPEGRKSFFLERPGKEPYEVTVTFTNGVSLTTPVHVLGAVTDGS